MEGIQDEIVFTARSKDWMVVKKFLIVENTKPEEISLSLASIDATLVRKSYEFAGIKPDVIDAFAQKLAAGKKKNWPNLAEALSSLKPSEIKKELLLACTTPEQYPIAEIYFLKALTEAIGFRTVLDPQTLADVYPHLKVSKPRGNFGKKKK